MARLYYGVGRGYRSKRGFVGSNPRSITVDLVRLLGTGQFDRATGSTTPILMAIGDTVVDVTVTATGVSATGTTGSETVIGDANVDVTGVEGVAALGTVSAGVSVDVAVTGVSATGSTGDASVSGTAGISAVGVSAAVSLGDESVSGSASAAPVGVVGTSGSGTPGIAGGASTTATGVFGTGFVGDESVVTVNPVSVTVPVTGTFGSSGVGTVTVTITAGDIDAAQRAAFFATGDLPLYTPRRPAWIDPDSLELSAKVKIRSVAGRARVGVVEVDAVQNPSDEELLALIELVMDDEDEAAA